MPPKIAVVYDRMNTPYGGAEQVLTALHQAFPDAPFFTSVYDPHRATWAREFQVRPSFIQHLPGAITHHRFYAPLMPLAFESFDLDEFDVVISVTSAEAKGVITKPDQLHICYLLTPTRYLYSHREEYEQTHWPFQIPGVRWFSRKIFDYLCWWDQAAAARPDVIIPISELIKKRTEQYYSRDTHEVLYPPIHTTAPTISQTPYELPENYLVVISRLVPYKRIDVIIEAAQALGKSLVIVGEGPDLNHLQSLANNKVTFLGSVSDAMKYALLSDAQALIMPGVEDFGITAVEAVLAGTPVILHHQSGAAEVLPDHEVALHLHSTTKNELIDALTQLEQTQFDFARTKKNLLKYDIKNFVTRFTDIVETLWENHQKGSV